ncbi:MAG: TIM barrel protein [Planctomycetota bacterium]
MYKILNTRGLGVGGKQNELIELALTFGFKGVEVDMMDLVGRHDAMGKEFAIQFLQSAKIDMGSFKLPVDLGGTNEAYGVSIAKIDTILDLASTLNSKTCYVEITPNNENFSFQECFETHQTRLQELAERFAAHNINIGLSLQASSAEPPEGTFKFIQTAEELLTLSKAISQTNVGVCVDAWEWVLGGGTIDQLKSAGFGEVVKEIRLADISEGADRENIKSSDRTTLPGDQAGSFSFQLVQLALENEADIPVSAATDLSTYAGAPRDSIVKAISANLDLMLEGKDPAVVAAELAAAAAAEAAEEGDEAAEGESKESPAPAATN